MKGADGAAAAATVAVTVWSCTSLLSRCCFCCRMARAANRQTGNGCNDADNSSTSGAPFLCQRRSQSIFMCDQTCAAKQCVAPQQSSFIKQCSSVGHNFCLLLMAAITANQPALIRAHSRVIPRAIYQGATSTTATAGDKTVYSKGIGKERKERKRIGSRQVQPAEKIVLHHSLSEFHCITLLPY